MRKTALRFGVRSRKFLASSRPRRPGAVPPKGICRFHPESGAEACVDSCARSVTHLRDALPRVLVVSLAPAADAAKYAADLRDRTPKIPAVKLSASLVALALLAAGCGGQGTHASASPSPKATSSSTPSPIPSPVASPAPLTGAFAVLATPISADTYTVSIVGVDGKVVGSAQASSPTAVTCGDAAAAVLPVPISTSDDRAYYMDAQGVVRFLTVQGESGRATTVPVGGGRRSMFAVSPDDQRIAVIVSDFTSSGVSLRLYVEDLNGATNHMDIFTSSGAFGLWPIGWHGTDNLVVAKVPSCTQGGGPLAAAPRELHVVDPATAVRRFTIGGAQCVPVGPPTPAGVACLNPNFTQGVVLDWKGATIRSFAIPGPVAAYLSPDGNAIALVDNTSTTFVGGNKKLNLLACGWIDSTHVISGSDVDPQPHVGNITTGAAAAVAAKGTCAGRLPGGL